MQPDDLVYEAERAVWIMKYPARISNPQEYYDSVVGSRWFASRWPKVDRRQVTVTPSNHVHAWSDYTNSRIWLPPWAMCDFVLLHEIGHIATPKQDHGPKFLAAELALVGRFMGKEVERCLRHALLAYDLEIGDRVIPVDKTTKR